VDDVLATGGTIVAASLLLKKAGFTLAGAVTLLEIAGLGGAATLSAKGIVNHSLLIA
jgi:adenine phosphoribosyltransferase